MLASLAVQREFLVYGETLEQVGEFKYLGRQFPMSDDDTPAVRAHMVKAQRIWARVSTVLKGENAPPKVCEMF